MTPITLNGYPANPRQLESGEITAVLPDDRIVDLIGWTRIRVGCAGTGGDTTASQDWQWERERAGPPGLYALLSMLPAAIETARQARFLNKKRNTHWNRMMETIGWQLADDPELCAEAQSESLPDFLARL